MRMSLRAAPAASPLKVILMRSGSSGFLAADLFWIFLSVTMAWLIAVAEPMASSASMAVSTWSPPRSVNVSDE